MINLSDPKIGADEPVGFAAASHGSEEFTKFFRANALRYLLPLTAAFIGVLMLLTVLYGSQIPPHVYVLAGVCTACAILYKLGQKDLSLRIFFFGSLAVVASLSWPTEVRPSGFATGGIYMLCMFPVVWWMCFPERKSRLLVTLACVIVLCLTAVAGQSAAAVPQLPTQLIYLGLARCIFIMGTLVSICHGFEIAIARYDRRWRESYAEQENLTLQLRNHGRDLSREADAHHETLMHLSRSETRLRHLFDNAFDGIVLFDYKAGIAHEINQGLADMLGYELATLYKLHPLALSAEFQPDGRSSHEAFYEIMREAGLQDKLTYEWTHRHANGHPVDVEITICKLPGEESLRMSVFRDITERNNADRELQMANRELRTFAHAASHDLKEPLRTMSNFAKLLGRRYSDVVDERGREYINFITDAATRGTSLVHDLLEYAELGMADVETVPTNLTVAAATVRQNVEAQLREAGATLTIDPLPTVMATPTWAHQLLQNLVSNALKFGREGVAPKVSVTATSSSIGHEIKVIDNGIGIAQADLGKVFGVFERLVRRDEFEGNGLGLALCRRIVERLGGDLWVESTPGVGTTFTVWLPTMEPAAGTAAEQRKALAEVQQLKKELKPFVFQPPSSINN